MAATAHWVALLQPTPQHICLLAHIQPLKLVGPVLCREKLGVQQPEFDKWKFAFVSIRAPPEYLSDEDVPAERFAKAAGYQTSESNYLGLEHEDKGPKRPSGYQRYNCERPVKIYN